MTDNNQPIQMSRNDLAEFAGLIVGKLMRWVLGCLIVVFLIMAAMGQNAKSAPVEPVKVEQVKKKTVKTVKAKKVKKAKKKACKCKCPKPAKIAEPIVMEKITIEPQKLVDIEVKLL